MVKVVTINILYDMTEWELRRPLLVEGLRAEKADLIALQEVKLPENTAAWLADKLGMPYVQLVPDRRSTAINDTGVGNAILSRYPFVTEAVLDLQTQGRVAHYVEVNIDGRPLVLCNGHYYWYPGHHPERVKQVQLVMHWLSNLPASMPIVVVGDFNGTPDTPAIELIKQYFDSAYAKYHGQEPEYTCPTPLPRRNWKRVIHLFIRDLISNRTLRPWRGTLDYIFINKHLRVRCCDLILDQPSPQSRTLYPSDHFGIVADLEIL
ncbi:MAG: endonuclease/exonuclease/phosphatase family protein [Scytonematopsis contorta HA4267-MV1]|jgi:endonuclease/exonuclease/phosphatase family metal-dependent hydrolase|nr:endonuclease/exonuclease/phosphatase family protein [Scytonematopsis contorta HA4267-MV1]